MQTGGSRIVSWKPIMFIAVLLLVAPAAAFARDAPGIARPITTTTSTPKLPVARLDVALPDGISRCVALRSSMGVTLFTSAYGAGTSAKYAFGACVAQMTRANLTAKVTASASCNADRTDAGFAQIYDPDGNGSSAFGKCVSQRAKALADAAALARVKAAKSCRAQLRASAGAFRAKFRTIRACVAARTAG
jgi:hypothetical protein